jgi:hypothetical protein
MENTGFFECNLYIAACQHIPKVASDIGSNSHPQQQDRIASLEALHLDYLPAPGMSRSFTVAS